MLLGQGVPTGDPARPVHIAAELTSPSSATAVCAVHQMPLDNLQQVVMCSRHSSGLCGAQDLVVVSLAQNELCCHGWSHAGTQH